MKIIGLLINTKTGYVKADLTVKDSTLRKALVKPTTVNALLGAVRVPVTISCAVNNASARKLTMSIDLAGVKPFLGMIYNIRVQYVPSAGEPEMSIDVSWQNKKFKRHNRNAELITPAYVEHVIYLKADVGRDNYHALYTKSYRDENRLGVLLPKGVNWFCTVDQERNSAIKLIAATKSERVISFIELPDADDLKVHFEKHVGGLLPELAAEKLEALLGLAFDLPGTFIKG